MLLRRFFSHILEATGVGLVQYFAFKPEETIIWNVCFVWAFSELVGGKLVPALRRKETVNASNDKGSPMVGWLSIFVSIVIAFFFGTNEITPLPDWFFYLGIALSWRELRFASGQSKYWAGSSQLGCRSFAITR
jgi:hypothetical protein